MSISRDFDIEQYRDDDDQAGGGAQDRDQVGYAKPPRAKQFKKGQSGNPKGRPKGSGIRDAVDKVLQRTVLITVDGKQRRVPVTEAMMMQLTQRGLSGDPTASRDFMKIADQSAQAHVAKEAKDKENRGFNVQIVRFGPPDDCNGALELLDVIVEVGDGSGQLRVQPWVVEAAQARGLNLSQADQDHVEAFTVTPEDVPILWERERERVVTHR
jgi:hypothetical protein